MYSFLYSFLYSALALIAIAASVLFLFRKEFTCRLQKNFPTWHRRLSCKVGRMVGTLLCKPVPHGPHCDCSGCFYGYPSCCVTEFYDSLELRRHMFSYKRKQGAPLPLGIIIPYTRTEEQEQLFASKDLTGFCPCHTHAVLLLKGDCTPESLIQPYRKAPNPFATHEMTRGRKKLIAQCYRHTEPQKP
jgi:hypothetical protein